MKPYCPRHLFDAIRAGYFSLPDSDTPQSSPGVKAKSQGPESLRKKMGLTKAQYKEAVNLWRAEVEAMFADYDEARRGELNERSAPAMAYAQKMAAGVRPASERRKEAQAAESLQRKIKQAGKLEQAKADLDAAFSGLAEKMARVSELEKAEKERRIKARAEMQTKQRAAAVIRMRDKFGNVDDAALCFGAQFLKAAGHRMSNDIKAELITRQVQAKNVKSGEITPLGQWVYQTYYSEVWSYAERQSRILPYIQTADLKFKYGQFYAPVEASGINWYSGRSAKDQLANPAARDPYSAEELAAFAEAGVSPPPLPPETTYTEYTQPSSRIGTLQVAGKPQWLVTSFSFTGEFGEDSMTDWAPALMSSISGELARLIDGILCDSDSSDVISDPNDDTSANENIAYFGHSGLLSESETISVERDPLLLFNGFRKWALDNSKATGKSGAALSQADIFDAGAALEVGPSAPHNIVTVVPSRVKTAYVKTLLSSSNADVIKTDADGNIFIAGNPLVFCENIARRTSGLTDAAGKMNNTLASNDKISIIAFDKSQWRLFRFPILDVHVRRVPRSDSFDVTASARLDLKSRPGTAQGASMLFGLDPSA